MMYDRYREQVLARRVAEQLEQEERGARARAGSELAHLLFGAEASAEEEAPAQAESAPVPSADAGARGIEPEVRKTPGEQLAGILLFGEGVPAEPWRRGL